MNLKQVRRYSLIGANGFILGGFIGLVAWAFLITVSKGIHFVWDTIPHTLNINFQYYPVLLCTLGGILVGLCQKYFGDYPHEMHVIMSEFKTTKRVEYKTLHKTIITALIVLIFGASLGPEAGLVGIVSGLCTWMGNKLWSVKAEREIYTQSGIAALIGVVFVSPFFGLFSLDKEESRHKIEVSNVLKSVIYLVTASAAVSTFIFLSKISHRQSFIVKYGNATLNGNDWIAVVPLIIIGIAFGYFYFVTEKLLHRLMAFIKNHKIIKAVIGGLVLGLTGTFLPLTMFSGEHQLKELVIEWHTIPVHILFLTALLKLFITQFCLQSGWKGGHIFPVVFSGSCLGYAMAVLLSIDPVTSVAIVTTTMTCFIIKKPVAVVLLFIIFFPMNIWLLIAFTAFTVNLFYILKNKWSNSKQKVVNNETQNI